MCACGTAHNIAGRPHLPQHPGMPRVADAVSVMRFRRKFRLNPKEIRKEHRPTTTQSTNLSLWEGASRDLLLGLIVVPRTQLLVCDTLLVRIKHSYHILQRKYKIPVVVWRGSPSPGPALDFVFSPCRLELLLRHSEHVPDRFVRLSVRLLTLC